ncbi:MAG: aspartate carbamoyltransferase regulatory subunit [Clostridiales bacterium]|nr:aspartate carbamoyltransferase regulatory subunit [Clostridiales bacterium]
MLVNPIKNGTVLDHITAGRGMELYRILKLNELECPVAIITNAYSLKMGCKDIIKIDGEAPLDLNVVGYVDPGVTVSIIRDGDVAQRIHLKLPQQITGVIRCKNPRCITSIEQELPHTFRLDDPKGRVYRCIYCESRAK